MANRSSVDKLSEIAHSWECNAEAWVAAVRTRSIASRRLGTDDAILMIARYVINAREQASVLDVGCGEGWLAHALARMGARVTGTDAVASLIRCASEACTSPDAPHFLVASHEALADDPGLACGPFDMIVCNYSLFGEDLVPTLAALRLRLAPGGLLVIQTIHPWTAKESLYRDGWREETFAGMGPGFRSTMPWYYRTLGGWCSTLATAQFHLEQLIEPLDPAAASPLSLIIVASPMPRP